MRTFGPLYGAKIRYWHVRPLPIVEVGWTQETEPPFRKGKCLVFRRPTSEWGYAIGAFYSKPKINLDDEEAVDGILAEALNMRKVWEPEDGLYDDVFQKDR